MPSTTGPTKKTILGFALILAAMFVAYSPAINGSFIWDDPAHVTRPELRSLRGLLLIWIDPFATQQYYPVVHSAFWAQAMLWGDTPWPYHMVNLLQHFASSVLIFLLLRKLQIPGAMLAGAVFALHPVMVESVAWVSELKNTQSTLLYLLTLWFFMKFEPIDGKPGDRPRHYPRLYLLVLVLFALALLSKSVTASLPGAILVIYWWKLGKLSWKRQVVPLLPMVAMGLSMGLFTAWVEVNLIGAKGQDFELNGLERLLLASRIPWFYLSKLFMPIGLMFSYPRWHISGTNPGLYVYPLATVSLIGACWKMRRRWGRGPLAALLFFGGSLFPALGFFNVYPFTFSFVADHFQYLASLGIITATAAGLTLLARHWNVAHRPAGVMASVVILGLLGFQTWRQARVYKNIDALWLDTLAQNPGSWMAANNYGASLLDAGREDEAIRYFQKSWEINSKNPLVAQNIGAVYLKKGDYATALSYLQKAVELDPFGPVRQSSLGATLAKLGQFDEAMPHLRNGMRLAPNEPLGYTAMAFAQLEKGDTPEARLYFQRALHVSPVDPVAHFGMGRLHERLGDREQARDSYARAIELDPRFTDAGVNLAIMLAQDGRVDEALRRFDKIIMEDGKSATAYAGRGAVWMILKNDGRAVDDLRRSVALNPFGVDAWRNLAAAQSALGQTQDALASFRKCLELNPRDARARLNLGSMLHLQGRLTDAAAEYRQALALDGSLVSAHFNLGQLLLEERDVKGALEELQQTLRLRREYPEAWLVYGKALLLAGQPAEARSAFEKALRLRPGWKDAEEALQALPR